MGCERLVQYKPNTYLSLFRFANIITKNNLMKNIIRYYLQKLFYKYYNFKYNKYKIPSIEFSNIIDKKPKKAIDIIWWKSYHTSFPWRNPITLNEKISYLSGSSDTSLWSLYTDKFEVRKHIEELGLKNILTKCYGVWESTDEIDFSALPDSFAIKCTHDCGSTIIVEKRPSELDIQKIKNKLNKHFSKKYGYETVEPHYTKIKPRIMAEELLPNITNGLVSCSAVDYKIWCINNKAEWIMVCYDRNMGIDDSHTAIFDLYDVKSWEPIRQYLSEQYRQACFKNIPKPTNYDQMIKIAEILSAGFPVVRIDLYNINGKIFFGEMTFTEQGGRTCCYTEDFQKIIGEKIKI